jgi:hypothetical protein
MKQEKEDKLQRGMNIAAFGRRVGRDNKDEVRRDVKASDASEGCWEKL